MLASPPSGAPHPLRPAEQGSAQTRRLLAQAAIYDVSTCSEAALLGDVTLQIVRDWVSALQCRGSRRADYHKAAGPKSLLTDAHRPVLAAQINRGPIPAAHGVVRWRLCDLGQWLRQEFHVPDVERQTLSDAEVGNRGLPAPRQGPAPSPLG